MVSTRKVLLPVFLLAAILIISCKGVKYPANLVIEGITSENIKGNVLSINEEKNTLIFSVKTDEKEHMFTVQPWAALNLFKGSSYTCDARQFHEPDGPVRFIKLYQNSNLAALFCDNVKRLPAPFNGVLLKPGEKIKGEKPTNRQWVDVVCTNADTETNLLPGKQYTIEVDGKDWILFIFGASVPATNKKNSAGADAAEMVGEKGKDASEEPEFVVDCVLFRVE